MKIAIPQPQKERIAKRYYEFLEAHYYSHRSQNRTGHEKASALSVAKDLYHFREMLPEPLNDFNEIIATCPEYGLLSDITVVDKHYIQTKKNKHREPLLKSSDDIQEVVIATHFRDEQGEYQNHQQTILLALQAGPMKGFRQDILVVLTKVINYWRSVLCENGIIKDNQPFAFIEVQHIPRQEAKQTHFNLSNAYPHEVEVFHVVYNPANNNLLPIDPSMPRMVRYRVDWDNETDQYTVRAAFEPQGTHDQWKLSAEDMEGNSIEVFEKPVDSKLGL